MGKTSAKPAVRSRPPAVPRPAQGLQLKLSLALALLTFFVYLPVLKHNFVNYDDEVFVTNNPKVAAGLTWGGVKWAFTSADIDYWRPLSWLSHMVDIEFFGAAAGLHHLTNVLIHIAATILCLLALTRLTGEMWPSAVVAGLFALHPLHVESVAWVAERKDVLCGSFWFFTLWAYARYVEQPRSRRYALVCAGFLLGLMSKPMIITLPFVLLLLDFWPLGRLKVPPPDEPAELRWRSWRADLGRLAWEKAPLFAAVLLLTWATMLSQHKVGTMSGLTGVPLEARTANALTSYGVYLSQTLWPTNLCVLYLLDLADQRTWSWLGSGLLILLLLAAGWRWRRTHAFVLVGWLWFLGGLVPVIGLVQVGEQAHADRYTYLPLTGVFLMVSWAGWRWAEGRRMRQTTMCVLAVGILLACAFGSHRQLRHWEDTSSLFRRAMAVTADNVTAMNNYASDLMARGQAREAIPFLREAIRLRPFVQEPYFNLGWIYAELGDESKAMEVITEGFAIDPRSRAATEQIAGLAGSVQANPGNALRRRMLAKACALQGNRPAAVEHWAAVLKLRPTDVEASVEHAALLAESGRMNEAVTALESTVGLAPTNTFARRNLAAQLSRAGRLEAAVAQLRTAAALEPDHREIQMELAVVLSRAGRAKEACQQFEAILKSDPTRQSARLQLAWLLATRTECRDGATALRLAQEAFDASPTRSADLLDTLAAAHAAAGNYERALAVVDLAISAASTDEAALRTVLQQRRQRYLSRQPHTEAPDHPATQP